LNPKKAKTLYKEVATDLGFDETLVKDVLDFYWQSVRKSMSGLGAPRLEIINLGTFEIMFKPLEEKIQSYIRYSEMQPPKTFKRYDAYSETTLRLKRLTDIKKELASYKIKKQEIINKRYATKDKENLEE
jgi:hypothetical protein